MELKSTFEIGRPEPYCSLTTASRNAQPGLRVACVTKASPFQTGSVVGDQPDLADPRDQLLVVGIDAETARREDEVDRDRLRQRPRRIGDERPERRAWRRT